MQNREEKINKEMIVFWQDAVLFLNNKPKNLAIKAHSGIVVKNEKEFIIIRKPKEISYINNKIKTRELKYNFLFIPRGMILKIIPKSELRNKLSLKYLPHPSLVKSS
ncbi:MAG: hypothetical protein KatS3mg095_0639 [Candidatus Parcubacteria bacterium]|nr:MAG: hypothetical protein KatS3mg095_0639 [Candidatus Parcubacteria bacterium]